jgi:hypothetical protein
MSDIPRWGTEDPMYPEGGGDPVYPHDIEWWVSYDAHVAAVQTARDEERQQILLDIEAGWAPAAVDKIQRDALAGAVQRFQSLPTTYHEFTRGDDMGRFYIERRLIVDYKQGIDAIKGDSE